MTKEEKRKIEYQNNKEYYKNNAKAWTQNNKTKKKETDKAYYEANKEKIDKRNKEYAQNNKEKLAAYKKKWAEDNRERLKEKRKEYWDKNKAEFGKKGYERKKERLKNDPFYKLKDSSRSSVYNSLYRMGYTKKSKTYKILGCTFEEFKTYIESKFEPWMNWDNHGLYNGEPNFGWDLDHIIPISSAKTEQEIIDLNHYTNFQPLCSQFNRYVKIGRLGINNEPTS